MAVGYRLMAGHGILVSRVSVRIRLAPYGVVDELDEVAAPSRQRLRVQIPLTLWHSGRAGLLRLIRNQEAGNGTKVQILSVSYGWVA